MKFIRNVLFMVHGRLLHNCTEKECISTGKRWLAICKRWVLLPFIQGSNLSRRQLKEQVYPYLLRNLSVAYPNHVWGIDITYIRMQRGWMYLVAILDWYSRYVVNWQLDQTLEMPFVLMVVQQALEQAVPSICNSDQGSHFTSPQYLNILKAANVQISMDSKGRALDNIFTERLWRTVKYEEVYIHDYASPREARQALTRYFQFYNRERPHQALEYQIPAEVYFRKSTAEQIEKE
jgi:putative transposase